MEQELDGPTDYASVGYNTQIYTSNQTNYASIVDNASYAGFRINSTFSIFQINLANVDAGIRKVGIPFPPPANLTVTPSGSNINLSWDNSTSLSNTYDIYRSTDNVSWTLVTSISGYGNTTYTDSSLADGTYYYKIGANGTYYTPDNSTVASGVIATASPAFKYSITGNDSDVSEDGTSDTTSLNLYLDAAPNGMWLLISRFLIQQNWRSGQDSIDLHSNKLHEYSELVSHWSMMMYVG